MPLIRRRVMRMCPNFPNDSKNYKKKCVKRILYFLPFLRANKYFYCKQHWSTILYLIWSWSEEVFLTILNFMKRQKTFNQWFRILLTLRVKTYFYYTNFLEKTSIPPNNFLMINAPMEKDRITLTLKASIFSTQGENNNFHVEIHCK